MSFAKITIAGNLTRDPEVRPLGGQQACNFTVAHTPMPRNGQPQEANYYRCTLWGPRIDYLMKYAQKGTTVVVTGDLSLVSYSKKDGTPEKALEVRVNSVDAIAKLKEHGGQEQPYQPAVSSRPAPVKQTAYQDEDELPF